MSQDTDLAPFVKEEDLLYFQARVRRDGLVFLTEELPRLGKALERAFETGRLERIEGFACSKDTSYPRFLSTAWRELFRKDGCLTCFEFPNMGLGIVPENSVVAVQCIRQLALLFYKVKLPYNETKIKSVTDAFLQTEERLATLDFRNNQQVLPTLERARLVLHRLLCGRLPDDLNVRHGSGASACKVAPWNRYTRPRWNSKLNSQFNYCEWFYSGLNGVEADIDYLLEPVEPDVPLRARVTFVPKDSRGPRLISCEPREHLYLQFAYMDELYDRIERYSNVREQVSCLDQQRNRRLAALASTYQSHTSLDMKEASDSVSADLVQFLFPPHWVEKMFACRSCETVLPDGTIVPLRKFAPMGSALCFPVEALIFWALSVACMENTYPGYTRKVFSQKAEDSLRSDANLMEAIAVFGDDIIVPTCVAPLLKEVLANVGLIVNENKSYSTGPFRESCGGDYFLGKDVGIVRLRHLVEEEGPFSVVAYSRYRTVEMLSRASLHFGTWVLDDCPFRKLYKLWYGVDCVEYVPSEDEILTAAPASRAYIRMPATRSYIPTRIKTRVKNGVKTILTYREVSVDVKVDTDDWSHVLRAFRQGSRDRTINGGPDMAHIGVCTLAKRTDYKYGWTEL